MIMVTYTPMNSQMHFSLVKLLFFTIPMNSLINPKAIAFLLLLLLSPASCFTSLRGVVNAQKARLGSRPPSCHNKCNRCHPCMAAQVPTHDRVMATVKNRPDKPMLFFDPTQMDNRYSNYKPLGWKCQCGDHFYNP